MSFRDETKIRKQIEVTKDDFEWYIRTHHVGDDTNKTGFSALMAMLLHSYRTVCENPSEHDLKTVSFRDLTIAAAKNAKDD